MGLASLNAALSGLRVSQQQINVISNNVANVGTPGYTRKLLPQSAQSIEGATVGVRAETIIRNVDINLERDLWTQVSSTSFHDIQVEYLDRIQQFHGPPDQELSVAAELARLKDAFAILADTPEDAFALSNVVNEAQDASDKINNLSKLLTTLRNDAQNEIESTVTEINGLLRQIADLNDQVQVNTNLGRSTALLEDQRDEAINGLSQLIEISFFQRGDGVLVVQTNDGAELASDRVTPLTFDGNPLGPTSYYPDSVNGVFVGDPDTQISAVDITTRTPGGKLGGLIELRDTTFPKQMAQLDELAHKTALRFEAQGLRLFTDSAGLIPNDDAPDPTTVPPTPVNYVGFSATIQVNQAILNDNTLIRTGTYGASLQSGDNQVIRRIIENTFSAVNYQQAENTDVATQVDLLNRGGDDLQTWLGLFSENRVEGGLDLASIGSLNDLIASAGTALAPPNDQFQITFEEARAAPPLGPTTVTIDLSVAAALPGANALDQLVTHINNEITAAGVPAGLAALASVGPNGQLVIETRGSYSIDSTGVNGMGQAGLNFIGLTDSAGATIAPSDPYFDIQVGNADPTRIFIEPGETDATFLAKLDAVPGVAVDTVNFALDGILRIRPGDDFDNPDFGGDIKITSGAFETSGASYGAPPALTARTSLDDGASIVSALFGSYTIVGGAVQNTGPVRDIGYTSETNGSLTPPIPTQAFRERFLGPAANININIIGADSLVDFAQKMVSEQSQELTVQTARRNDEQSLRELLNTQLLDESAVNIDEELGHLILVQTAYSASARVLSAVDELFQELLNAVRR